MKYNLEQPLDTTNDGSSSGPLFLFILSLGAFFIDRFTKMLCQYFAPEAVSINTGLSFGIAAPRALIIILLAVASAGFLALCLKLKVYRTLSTTIPAALIGGGAASNIYDRLHHGGVVDIFHLSISRFNTADIFIIGGSILLLISLSKRART